MEFYNRNINLYQNLILISCSLLFTLVPIPKVSDMEKNVSVMLLNSYAPLTTTRPTIAGMIPVGGMHIYPPRALPEDIQKFLDDAKDGVIYFSLGELLQREKKKQIMKQKCIENPQNRTMSKKKEEIETQLKTFFRAGQQRNVSSDKPKRLRGA